MTYEEITQTPVEESIPSRSSLDLISSDLSNDPSLRFAIIRDYLKSRRDEYLEEMSTDTVDRLQVVNNFNTLQHLLLREDSCYIKRLLEWAMLREAHEAVSFQYFTVDRQESDPSLVEDYDSYWDIGAGELPNGLVYKLSDEGVDVLTEHPEYQDIFDFAADAIADYPWLGELDRYAPDPYLKLVDPSESTGGVGLEGTAELAMETTALFGVSYDSLSDGARQQLFDFGVRLTDEQYKRVDTVVRGLGDNLKHRFAETFLATKFGDDLGSSILTIAERASSENVKKTLDIMQAYREHSQHFAEWFQPFDPVFARAIENAMNERLSDALAVVEKVAVGGRVTVDTAPNQEDRGYKSDGRFDVTIVSVEDALATLRLLDVSMDSMHRIITSDDTVVGRTVQSPDVGFQIYRFHSGKHGDVLLHVRAQGASVYDSSLEYGGRHGVEATVSFVVNPLDPHHIAIDKDPNGVSIRFDREGRRVDESPASAERHPVNQEGTISLDISSIIGDETTPGVAIGRLIAAGNILRSMRTKQSVSLHHNTAYFDQATYGNANGFARLVRYVGSMAEALATPDHKRIQRSMGASAGQQAVRLAA